MTDKVLKSFCSANLLRLVWKCFKSALNKLLGPFRQGTLTEEEGRLSTVDLLNKVACSVKKVNHTFNVKSSWPKCVCTRRSTVL